MKPIPIIDLFAGPGGLGEGFSSVKDNNGNFVFDIRLSIEKDESAHDTLLWRSFYRQFVLNGEIVPSEYYKAYRESDLRNREEIIKKALAKYPQGEHASNEAQLLELGSKAWPAKKVDKLIKSRLGDKSGNWVLIGGPPCQAYSNAGRSRVGGVSKDDHRVYLYKEYLRIIKKHKPAVFVMENVKGLLSAKVGNEKVFDWMKKDLVVGGKYELHSFVKPAIADKDYLIRSEDYGVPQQRHRVILLGVKKGLKHSGKYLEKLEEQINLESVIGKLPKVRSGITKTFIGFKEKELDKNGKPKRAYKIQQDSEELWNSILTGFIDKMKVWDEIPLNGLSKGAKRFKNGVGAEFLPCTNTIENSHKLKDWYRGIDSRKLKGVANHVSKGHMTQDLYRYLFSGLFVEKYGTFPRINDYAKHSDELVPDHSNAKSGDFSDRFRVQIKDKPATTVTCHISKDGHYFIHYDPEQCRSLTVREAARIQTFPDNYLFRGSRTQQFHQVGNAVPPYLARQLGEIVKSILEAK
ncbi:DNA cytosine methyltransferase [Arenibacter sp. BSSL-BM3]|uniref:DNA (cytosine-5-)-methyltransferase n=1 Tax=Arenibacter arenosicollis TaxID=2762274 RepID=A0ABR7QTC8_9FLAO|nr:DNA cytosine methyltransferase [Arenibacter arenosicollis]MBC8770433.1 DNA cytosine methyltransferase [Arenibacter arenosicollis]